jgi:arylsulfatase
MSSKSKKKKGSGPAGNGKHDGEKKPNGELRTYDPSGPFSGKVGRTARDSEPAWPRDPRAPEGAPNVLLIVLDDVGFGQLGCYGGPVDTPNLDALAARGLRYNNFHTTSLCSPSRAALLTGRNAHKVGFGTISERATGFPGYNARIPKEAAMLPAILSEHGYTTMALGKWHLAPDEHNGPWGPFDRWPLGQGFDRFYGFLPGDTSQWVPDLWEDNHTVDPPKTPAEGYHLSADLVDHAEEWIATLKAVSPSHPFFLYLAFGAAHSPHHAPQEWIDRYKGRFDAGWDVVRQETFARQKKMGIVPEKTVLPPHNEGVRPWAELSPTEQRVFARQMEVFAAFLSYTDDQIGRLVRFLEQSGELHNTLLMVVSDNGASPEGGTHGLFNEIGYFNGVPESTEELASHLGAWGSPESHPHYATGWAEAGNTPNRWYKSTVHEGGTRDPLIIHFPARIEDAGKIRSQFHHIVDFVPSILESVGIAMPSHVRGHEQMPLQGTSFAYTFSDASAPTRKTVQYFEMFAHRAIWADGWKAVVLHWSTGFAQRIGLPNHEVHDGDFDADRWELYHLDEDYSEMHDLAAAEPERLKQLIDLWWKEAEANNVLPLDDALKERMLVAKPRVFEERDRYEYEAPVRLGRTTSPDLRDRSHTITAEIEVPPDGAEGVIVSNGGASGGYTLCLKDGKAHYVVNYLGREHYVASTSERIPNGLVTLRVEFTRTGKQSGRAELYVNERRLAASEIPHTNPVAYAAAEGLEIGSDTTSPVWPGYVSPFRFTGTIHKVAITTSGARSVDVEGETRRAMMEQ